MTFSQRIDRGKPYLTGFILGLIAAPIIAFSAGWVSTTGARAEAVENARIETLASFCAAEAQKSMAAQKIDPASLQGWNNRAKREEVVASAMGNLQMPEPLVTKVTKACDKTLA
jgi:hypothetical protein